MKVAVSYLKSNDYEACIKEINNTDADYIHVDLCDGKYVETKNFTTTSICKILKNSQKPLDIHLMVKDPLKYIDDLAVLNTETITFHLDGAKNPSEVIDYILSIGIKVGVAIKPEEDISILDPYLDMLDEVLILSVHPGKGGQAFMPEVISKIDKLNEIKGMYHFTTLVDGGINIDTIRYLEDKNVDMVVSGAYITDSDDYNKNIHLLKEM